MLVNPVPQRSAFTVVYPLDPLGPKVGGSVGFIRGLLQYAPPDLTLRFVGVTCDADKRPPMQWRTQWLGERPFQFLPVLHEPREDLRRRIPLSLRFVRRLRADMIEGPGTVVVHNRPETLLARGMGQHRNLVFIHNDVPAQIAAGAGEVLWSRLPWLYYQFERLAFKRADRVYTVSGSTLADCQRRYADSPDKFAFLPTWADPGRFRPSATPRASVRARLAAQGLAIDPLAPWVLFVGRLQPQKAPQRMLEAFLHLRRHHADAQLIIIGDGNLRATVEARIRHLCLAHCVHVLGALDQAALPAHYQAADLLLLASDFEGMPMCVLEALACGLPVVSTRVGEVARVVGPPGTGEIAIDMSAQALCEAMARVLAGRSGQHAQACAAAVRPYGPQQVLAPIYARIHELLGRTP